MPTRQNRYFNNPQMAAAFSNLAGIFAPPSAQDFYAMSRTDGQDFQNQAIRQAWEAMSADGVTPQTQDRFGIAATLFGQGFNPTQSNRAVDIASADRRYGVDVGAQNALAVQGMRNEQSGREAAFGAAVNPQGRQAISDADIAATLGLEIPGFGAAGPVAPTAAQVEGWLLEQAVADGIYGPQDAANRQRGLTGTTNAFDDENNLVNMLAADAVGQRVPNPQQSAPRLENYRTPEGRTGTARFMEGQGWVDSQTGEALPPGIVTGSIQGTADDFTSTMRNRETERFVSATEALDTIGRLEAEIAANPSGVVGISGGIQRFVQNTIATIDEVSQLAGGATPTFDQLVEMGGVQVTDNTGRDVTGEWFNPSLPRVQLLTNQLLWAYVSAQQGSGRVSNEQLTVARDNLQANSWNSNNRAFAAALGVMREELEVRRDRAAATGTVPRDILEAYGGRPPAPAQGAQPAAAPAFQPGALPKPDDVDPGVWNFLTEDEQRMWLNGRSR